MRLCSLDIEESIQIEFVKRIKESAREYLEATDSITRIGINQAGQKSNAVAKAVNQINELFGGKAAKIAFEDDGQKYIDIKPDPAFVDRVFKKYEEREDARNVQRQDAERSGITYDDWYLFKLKGNDNQATLDQVKAAKEWWDKSPLSKNIGLQEAFNVVNSNAFAQWTQYGITLFHGANYTDIYHEAFHGFSQLYLTKGQKQALYNEARKVLGSKLTDFQVEETLAEDFRKYVWSAIAPQVADAEEELNKVQANPETTDGKKTEDGKKTVYTGGSYKACTGTYTQGCKSEAIKKVQGCLGLVADGKFGPKTQKALTAKGFTGGFTDADVDKICKVQASPEPKKDAIDMSVDTGRDVADNNIAP